MERTLISKKELTERWNLSEDTIDRLSQTGILHPRKKIGVGKYYIGEVESLEQEGITTSTVEEYKHQKKVIENQKILIQVLQSENHTLRAKIKNIKSLIEA